MSKRSQRGSVWTIGLAVGVVFAGLLDTARPQTIDTADGIRQSVERQPLDSDKALRGARIHPTLVRRWAQRGKAESVKAWVFFTDKGLGSHRASQRTIEELSAKYNPRATQRRRLRRTRPGLFDFQDLAVSQGYIEDVKATGAKVHIVSKWLNAVSVRANKGQLERIEKLPFVRLLQPVARRLRIEAEQPGKVEDGETRSQDRSNPESARQGSLYDQAELQLSQINLIEVHSEGFTGVGIIVGVLDTGFRHTHIAFNEPGHVIDIVAEWDFLNNDGNTDWEPGDPIAQHGHGTNVLGTIGSYKPDELMGAAYGASFILCKTEDNSPEYPSEEDAYIAGLEFVEANGGDVVTASLSYLEFDPEYADSSYTQADMDGMTAVTTIGVNVATANGLHCINVAGNRGHDFDPETSHLGAPADALQVITVGAVSSTGATASFSGDGPTADGRVKPEVLALGVNARTVSSTSDTAYTGVGGTSFSAPLTAGAVACLVQARPTWTVAQMRHYLFQSARHFVANGTFDPLYIRGYGIVDAAAALSGDCNGNGQDDAAEIVANPDLDCDGNGLPDECDLGPVGDGRDCNGNGIIDFCDVLSGSPDCNGNFVPDICDRDCDGDTIPDVCEVELAEQDCNSDGICNEVAILNCPPGDPACNDCNINGIPDECDISLGTSTDSDYDGVPDDCAPRPAVAPAPYNFRKNRSLAFSPNNLESAAIRVELAELVCSVSGEPCSYNIDCPSGEACVTQTGNDPGGPDVDEDWDLIGWVGDPCLVPTDTQVPSDTFTSLVVGTMPPIRLFTEQVVFLTDCEIQPRRSYALSATKDGSLFSKRLIIGTIREPGKNDKNWADVVGQRYPVTGEYTVPNERINVDDVSVFIVFLNNKAYRPHISVLDLSHEVVDYRINADDLSMTLRAFNITEDYPPLKFQIEATGAVHPSECPVDAASAVHHKCE